MDEVISVLVSRKLVQGEKVEKLENELSQYMSVKECIAVTNGTSSLHLILIALGIGYGDEVIIPAFSYIATANVVELVGAKPIFVDINIESFNIEKNQIEAKITSKTKAVMVVHEFGLSADVQEIKKLCDGFGLFMIEDAACALGAKEEGVHVGTIGVAGSFSFHPRKAITSGEGGCIVTNDSDLASRLRALRNHGIDPNDKTKNEFICAGFNCRMTDFQAVLLSSQLKRLNESLKRKNQIARIYQSHITNPSIKLPVASQNKIHAWQTFHILLNQSKKQKNIIEMFSAKGIGVNYGAQCIPTQKFFLEKYRHDVIKEFPNAMRAYQCGLAIPIYEMLTDEQVSFLVDEINGI